MPKGWVYSRHPVLVMHLLFAVQGGTGKGKAAEEGQLKVKVRQVVLSSIQVVLSVKPAHTKVPLSPTCWERLEVKRGSEKKTWAGRNVCVEESFPTRELADSWQTPGSLLLCARLGVPRWLVGSMGPSQLLGSWDESTSTSRRRNPHKLFLRFQI